jgi:hypothetical protein
MFSAQRPSMRAAADQANAALRSGPHASTVHNVLQCTRKLKRIAQRHGAKASTQRVCGAARQQLAPNVKKGGHDNVLSVFTKGFCSLSLDRAAAARAAEGELAAASQHSERAEAATFSAQVPTMSETAAQQALHEVLASPAQMASSVPALPDAGKGEAAGDLRAHCIAICNTEGVLEHDRTESSDAALLLQPQCDQAASGPADAAVAAAVASVDAAAEAQLVMATAQELTSDVSLTLSVAGACDSALEHAAAPCDAAADAPRAAAAALCKVPREPKMPQGLVDTLDRERWLRNAAHEPHRMWGPGNGLQRAVAGASGLDIVSGTGQGADSGAGACSVVTFRSVRPRGVSAQTDVTAQCKPGALRASPSSWGAGVDTEEGGKAALQPPRKPESTMQWQSRRVKAATQPMLAPPVPAGKLQVDVASRFDGQQGFVDGLYDDESDILYVC